MSPFRHVYDDRNETDPTGSCSASLPSDAHRSSAPAASSFRSHSSVGHSRGSSQSISSSLVQRSVSAITSRQRSHRGVMINGLVGNGISGILYKWVNYGRGWCARWFVLQDGVLSYFKIHGPNKLVLNVEVERGSMVIGEESLRRIASHRNNPSRQRKPVCEIHLMVCSIRESKSDERRFSVRTGTKKRLHLRAESREDRDAWVEALKAVKGLYPRSPRNAEIMAPNETMLMSTQKLRQRLLEEGVSEIAIQESENIMRSELAQMHKHIKALKQKQKLLFDSLRHLEVTGERTAFYRQKRLTWKTLVNETQRRAMVNVGDSPTSKHEKFSDGSPSDSSDDQDRHDQSDDDNDAFFDTSDILSLNTCGEHESDSDSEETTIGKHDANSPTGSVRSNYPQVMRRKKLPDPVEKEKAASLWSIIKDNIGKDLTSVCLPVYFNEPLSSLQKCCEDLEYSYLLDRAYEWGQKGNNLMRLLDVAAFAVSGYSSTLGRSCKPFNPLLGETYEADFPDKGFRFISEKVTTSIYNLILGKLYCDHYGTMRIEGNPEYSCTVKFKEQSIMDKNPHQVQGVVEENNARTVATIYGKWDESLHCVINDNSKTKKASGSSKPCLLWNRNEPPQHATRYNLTEFAIALNETTPGLKEKLPPTDSRLRPDQRFLENGEYEMANTEKLRLEQRQRQARRMQEKGWKPRWFVKDKDDVSYRYAGGYWEARDKGTWESCPDIFGQIPNDTDGDPPSPS